MATQSFLLRRSVLLGDGISLILKTLDDSRSRRLVGHGPYALKRRIKDKVVRGLLNGLFKRDRARLVGRHAALSLQQILVADIAEGSALKPG